MFVEGGGLEEVEFGLVGVWTGGGGHCGKYVPLSGDADVFCG